MSEIINFFKGIFMFNEADTLPIGLCGFECATVENSTKTTKRKQKREMRLSELMDNNNLE
ncbi:hypothetical protein IJD44_03375 [bacterium]|nr:hypothetical protein [bacterium]